MATLVFFFGGEARRLQFDTARIGAGEVWRLWSAHAVHFAAHHFCWSMVVLVPAGAWAEYAAPRRVRLFYLVAPAVIGATLLFFEPSLHRYGGLGAMAAGAVALLAFIHLGRTAGETRWLWRGVIVLLAGKIAYELVVQEPLLSGLTGDRSTPMPLAHVAAVACAALVHGTRRRFHV